jgi:hypothetical protein
MEILENAKAERAPSEVGSIDRDSESIFSDHSSASTAATEVSTESGYNARQIEVAAQQLLMMLRDNETLSPLFAVAIQQDATGKNRFRKRLYWSLKDCAKSLKMEACDSLEFLAARLVSHKARFLTIAIAGIDAEQSATQGQDSLLLQPTSDGLEGELYARDEDGINDENQTNYDDVMKQFAQVKVFLERSEAFQTLRFELEEYVNRLERKDSPIPTPNEMRSLYERTWTFMKRGLFWVDRRALSDPPGHERIDWQCVSPYRSAWRIPSKNLANTH